MIVFSKRTNVKPVLAHKPCKIRQQARPGKACAGRLGVPVQGEADTGQQGQKARMRAPHTSSPVLLTYPRIWATRTRAGHGRRPKKGHSLPTNSCAALRFYGDSQLPPGPPPLKPYQFLFQRTCPQVEGRHHDPPLGYFYLPLKEKRQFKNSQSPFS